MKTGIVFIGILLLFGLTSCEQGTTLSPNISRFIATEHTKYVDGKENLPTGMLEYLRSQSAKKFPLPYYLVSEDDMKSVFADQLDERISDQLYMRISGKKHYKIFVDPNLEVAFEFLRSSYSYIDSERTEFFASPIDKNQFVVWNRNNEARRPFIATISSSDVLRIVSNQRVFDRIGAKKLKQVGLSLYSHQVGLSFTKQHRLIEQLITDFPDDYLSGEKKWAALSEMKVKRKKGKPYLLDIISKSDLNAYEFIEKVLLDSYYKILEEIAFKNGMLFSPDALELAKDEGPTGFWVLKDLRGTYVDLATIAKTQFALDIFEQHESDAIFKFSIARAKLVESHDKFVSAIFGQIIPALSSFDQSLSPAQVALLKAKSHARFQSLLKDYYSDILLDLKTEIKDSENLRVFIDNKKVRREWISYDVPKEKPQYFLNDYALLEVVNKKVYSLFLFNQNEKEDYKDNKKMLSIFKMDLVSEPKGECLLTMKPFLIHEKIKTNPH